MLIISLCISGVCADGVFPGNNPKLAVGPNKTEIPAALPTFLFAWICLRDKNELANGRSLPCMKKYCELTGSQVIWWCKWLTSEVVLEKYENKYT